MKVWHYIVGVFVLLLVLDVAFVVTTGSAIDKALHPKAHWVGPRTETGLPTYYLIEDSNGERLASVSKSDSESVWTVRVYSNVLKPTKAFETLDAAKAYAKD